MELPAFVAPKFSYAILPHKNLIIQHFKGAFALSEIFSSVQNLWADPRYSVAYDGVVDLSQTSVRIPLSDFHRIIQFVSGHQRTSTGRWAAIVTSPIATAYLTIYKKAIAHRHVMEIFSTWEGACGFLGCEKDPHVENIHTSFRH